MERTRIIELLRSEVELADATVEGWVRTRRDAKGFSFLEINDGSCLKNIQVVLDADITGYESVASAATGSAVRVVGRLVPSQGGKQKWELLGTAFELVGAAPPDYPLQKKGHSREFLRDIAHLRPRANLFGAVFRTRSQIAFAIHQFFQTRGFHYVHTPIITQSDCEGAGEMFRVTTLDPDKKPDSGAESDFFGAPTFLTVSGQLEAEAFAMALSKVYTFGPTFRAENSNTSRHASEFWMIEPEMAFCDLQGDMQLAESFIKELIQYAFDHLDEELAFFDQFVDKGLVDRLRFTLERPFERLPYSEAIQILEKSGKKFEYPVEFGVNLQSEHERFLAEEHVKAPLTLYNYPKSIKPFYMRQNEDGRTVAAMDVIVPGIGEIIGGSQREERLDRLETAMREANLETEHYDWYLDLRRFGTAPHAGFGLGFERFLMFVTGVSNIRDVIPFARTPGNARF